MEGRVAEAPLSKPRDWGILAAFASYMTILSQSPAVSQPGAISVPLQCQDAFPAQSSPRCFFLLRKSALEISLRSFQREKGLTLLHHFFLVLMASAAGPSPCVSGYHQRGPKQGEEERDLVFSLFGRRREEKNSSKREEEGKPLFLRRLLRSQLSDEEGPSQHFFLHSLTQPWTE